MKKLSLILIVLITALSASGQHTIHVPGDYLSIQDGINAANNGDIVLVDEGTYVENIFFIGKKITVASQFFIDGEESHIENTIIDGSSASGEEWASVVHFNGGEDTTSILMGFTLINGEGYQNRMGGGILVVESGAKIVANKIIGCKLVAWQSKGAGIFAASWEDGTNYHIIIEDNIIEGDSAYCVENDGAFGGGIYIERMNAKIKGNKIFDNLVNGGISCLGGGICCIGYDMNLLVEIIENEIYGNKCYGNNNIGGGVYVYYCTTLILDNHIYSNVTQGEETAFSFAHGGGIGIERVNEGSIVSGNLIEKNKCKNGNWWTWAGGLDIINPEGVPETQNKINVDGNTFRKNKALWGAGSQAWRSNVNYTNNFFDDNYAQEFGGAIYLKGDLDSSEIINISNNTFYSNASVSSGASIYSTSTANIIMLNNLHWKNLGADEITVGLGNLEMYNCNIETDSINGEWEGSQNFRKDPMLEAGYVLASGSPCINRGVSNVLAFGETFYAPFHDIRRILRPQGDYIDVGAYELLFAESDTLEFEDLIRLYKVYLPQGYYRESDFPVVINLHGADVDAQFQMDWTGMNALADTMDFIVVYPEGVDNWWNAFLDGDVNDVGFIDALIDDLQDKYDIDPNRVYVCGYSLGGFMTTTLACQLSDRIAAVACVSGGMGGNIIYDCTIPRKMPVLVIHGTADEVIDYSTAEEMTDFWLSHNNCSLLESEILPDVDPDDGSTVEKYTYEDDDDQCRVLMYKVINGSHNNWPDAKWKIDTSDVLNMDINANLEIWNFFKQYHLSDFTDIQEFGKQFINVKSYPNPFTTTTTFEYILEVSSIVTITIHNHLGKQIEVIQQKQSAGKQQVLWNGERLPSGIYYCVLKTTQATQICKMIKLNH